jgi:cobalt-zinc-cadmium efflux system outer membrane protein
MIRRHAGVSRAFVGVSGMRVLMPVLLALCAQAAMAAAQETAVVAVEDVVAIALRNNPGLDAMRERARAAAAVPSQVGSLPDPRISLGAINLPVDSFALDQEPMTQIQIGISQMFPFPGTLGLRRGIAESQAAAAADSEAEARLRLVRDVRLGWWELFYLDRSADTIARNRELLRQLVDVARVKYEVGNGLQQDVLLAQVELSRLHDMAIGIEGMRTSATARLNALMARRADAPLALPSVLTAHLPTIASVETLQARADRERPLLAQFRHQLDAAHSAQALARKAYLPEFGVTTSYGWRQGYNGDGSERADFASAMFSVSVPLFANSKQDQLMAQRSRETAASEQDLDDTRNRVHADIAVAAADFVRARQALALLDDGILPQTAQAVASMQAGYQVSKVDFLSLVRTQATLYNYELQRWRVFSQAQQALASMAAAVGTENFDE